MKLAWSFLIAFQLIVATSFSQPKKIKKLQGILDKGTSCLLPGTLLYLRTSENAEWTLASGQADVERAIPMDKNFVFAVGSIGKMYTAVAAMKLLEEGKLGLDEKISEYLPDEIVSNVANGASITVRHLLGNTSGLYNYEFDPVLNALYLSDKLRLDTLSHLNVLRRYVFGKAATNLPGDEYHYSSTNFMLLAMIMDRICPEGHTQYIRRTVLEANSFNETFYRETPKRLVNHYGDINKDGVQENLVAKTIETTNWFIGDDGIYATISDAGHFLDSLIKGKLVSKTSLTQMTTWNDQKKPDYGLGLMADKGFPYKFLIGHSGRGISTTTDLFYFPNQDLTVAIFCNMGIRGSSDKIRKAYVRMRSKIVKQLFLHKWY